MIPQPRSAQLLFNATVSISYKILKILNPSFRGRPRTVLRCLKYLKDTSSEQ